MRKVSDYINGLKSELRKLHADEESAVQYEQHLEVEFNDYQAKYKALDRQTAEDQFVRHLEPPSIMARSLINWKPPISNIEWYKKYFLGPPIAFALHFAVAWFIFGIILVYLSETDGWFFTTNDASGKQLLQGSFLGVNWLPIICIIGFTSMCIYLGFQISFINSLSTVLLSTWTIVFSIAWEQVHNRYHSFSPYHTNFYELGNYVRAGITTPEDFFNWLWTLKVSLFLLFFLWGITCIFFGMGINKYYKTVKIQSVWIKTKGGRTE